MVEVFEVVVFIGQSNIKFPNTAPALTPSSTAQAEFVENIYYDFLNTQTDMLL